MSTKISGIYKITLRKDGRIYIGSAVNVSKRWQLHKNNANSNRNGQVITRALRKYGFDSFDWEIVEECPENILLEREQYYLDSLLPFVHLGRGFNVRKKADSNLGISLSKKTKQKMSSASKGKPKSQNHKNNMSKEWHKNRGELYFKKISERMIGDNNPAKRPEVRKKISESRMGQTWRDDENRIQKHTERMKKDTIFKTKEFQEQNRLRHLGSTRSEESRKRMSEWQQRTYEITSPEGNISIVQSKDLKEFCRAHSLSYSNLQQTHKTKKLYKGWILRII